MDIPAASPPVAYLNNARGWAGPPKHTKACFAPPALSLSAATMRGHGHVHLPSAALTPLHPSLASAERLAGKVRALVSGVMGLCALDAVITEHHKSPHGLGARALTRLPVKPKASWRHLTPLRLTKNKRRLCGSHPDTEESQVCVDIPAVKCLCNVTFM